MIAGGSGIVPLMAMIRARALADSTAPFRLLYSVRNPEAVFYRDELHSLSSQSDSIEVTYAYTRAVPKNWLQPPDRIDAQLVTRMAWPANLDPTCYVCGPTSFVEGVTELLLASGYNRDKIKTERFGATGAKNELQ